MYTPQSNGPGLAFVDTETTGLKPWHHEILQVAIVTPNGNGGSKPWTWESRVAPQRLETASPKALEINGLDPKSWINEPFPSQVALQVKSRLKGKTVVGHNVGFDLDFLRALCVESGVSKNGSWEEVLGIEGTVDTCTLVHEHLLPLGLRSRSLDSVRGFLGWSTKNAHTALQDALDVMKLYYLLNNPDLLDKAFIKQQVKKTQRKEQNHVQ